VRCWKSTSDQRSAIFRGTEARREGGREVVNDLDVFPLGHVVENRFDFGQSERIGRRLLHRRVLNTGSRIGVKRAVASRELPPVAFAPA